MFCFDIEFEYKDFSIFQTSPIARRVVDFISNVWVEFVVIENIQVVEIKKLIEMKQKAAIDRRGMAKGHQDEADLIRLLEAVKRKNL